MDLKKLTPWLLVGLRVVLAPLSIVIIWSGLPHWLWLVQFIITILSDIYDRQLARRWHVVTAGLRRADSIADTIMHSRLWFAVGLQNLKLL